VPIGAAVVERNPEVKWAESAPKGFVLLTLTRDAAKAEMRAVSTIYEPDYTVSTLKTFSVTPVEGVGVGPVTEG
jgi:alkaline phosphatase D